MALRVDHVWPEPFEFRGCAADELRGCAADDGDACLASTFSRDLTDFWMFVIDVAGGDDIPRKRGPGVVRSDLLVINKTDLAPFVGVNLPRMTEEALSAIA